MTRTHSRSTEKLVLRRAYSLFGALFAVAAISAIAAPRAWPNAAAVRQNGDIAYSAGARVRLITPSGVPVGTLPHCSIRDCNDVGTLAWSPGGKKLAVVRGVVHGGSPKPDKSALFVTGANGAHLRRLLGCGDCSPQGWSISWSPGGSKIAVSEGPQLALVNVRTRSHRWIARCAATSGYLAGSSAWSADGSRIAFACGPSLYVVDRTGGHAHVIANVPGQVGLGHLSWSPDGQALAFDAADSIYTIQADGSNLRTLLSGEAGSGPGFPSWSRDGTRILYAYTPGSPSHFFYEVWVMNADGTQKHRLYRSSQPLAEYVPPVWSPDGTQIAFSVLTNAQSALMLMNADGSGLHSIAPAVETLAWQPLP